MQAKHLIIVVVILEALFLGWTSFIDNQDEKGENIFSDKNILQTVTLAVLKKHSNDSISRVTRKEIYEVNHNYLDLKGKRFSSLPILLSPLSEEEEYENEQTINTLNQITHIDISSNYLTVFPLYFLKMKNLKKVFLGNNNIKSITIIQERLSFAEESTSIKTVDLSNNKIIHYSTNTLKLPNLQYLNLSGNFDLVKISIGKGDFRKLKELNIRNTALADDIEKIKTLYKVLPNDVKIIF
ncbi:MAG: hypothetical protein ACPG19_00530 [Saprospiraceae bacterium]